MTLPQVGDRVVYHGTHDNLVEGIMVERAIGPLTGNPRYRVVDSWGDAKDEGAGKWIPIEIVHGIYPPA